MTFGWQGGEPTLAGLAFYKKAIELQKQYGQGMRVSNALQTNGVLLDQEWLEFLHEYHFLVGISIDGTQHVHDRYRLSHNGKGTHTLVEKSAQALLATGIEVNALSVVNDYSVQWAAESYNYLKALGFQYLQFIPCVETDQENSRIPASFSVSSEAYGEFLCQIFDLWAADWQGGKPTTSERMMDNMLGIYLGLESSECTFRHACGDYLVVEHNGALYSCDFFVEDAWHLGHLRDEKSLEEILNSRRQEMFGTMKNRLPEKCRRCDYLQLCNGGCTKDRLRDPRDRRLNHFCAAYKQFHSYTHERFKSLAQQYRMQLQVDRNTNLS